MNSGGTPTNEYNGSRARKTETIERRQEQKKLWMCACLLLALVCLGCAPLFGFPLPQRLSPDARPQEYIMLQLSLTLPLLALTQDKLLHGVKALRDSAPSMTTLYVLTAAAVALDAIAAFAVQARGTELVQSLMFVPLGVTAWLTAAAAYCERAARACQAEALDKTKRQTLQETDADTESHLEALVDSQLSKRLPLTGTLDRLAGRYVPAALALAVAAGLSWWFASSNPLAGARVMAAALLIESSAALALAVPVSLLRAVNASRRLGIIWRDLDALEASCRASTILFDKTGTLTYGRPEVTLMRIAGEGSEQGLRLLAAALAGSECDALSDAFRRLGKEQKLPVCEEITGTIESGVRARSYKENVRLGPLDFARRFAAVPNEAVLCAKEWESQGADCYFLTAGRRLYAVFGVTDTLRSEAAPALSALREAGLRTVVLSGGDKRSSASLGRQAGADRVVSELRPEQKAEFIRTLQMGGEVVVTVGDWVNDAPALAQSDVGVAFGAGAGRLTLKSARAVLLNADLMLVPAMLRLARAAQKILRQNIFLALAVSVPTLPVVLTLPFFDGAVWAGPAGVSLVLAAGSALVFFNALRLR